MSVIAKFNPFRIIKVRKEKNLRLEKEHIEKTGIIINGNPEMSSSGKKSMLMTNAILNLLACYGTLGCFVSSFDINANMLIIGIAAIIMSVVISFLYYNSFVKTVGYLILFSGFIFLVMKLRYLLRGGFGHICNDMMEFLERNFGLPLERSYDVYNYGERFSVTIVCIFILFAVMLLFNMAITESKGFLMILMFTFPVVQIGLYFNKEVGIFYFALYVIAIIGLFIIRSSNHYKMETKKKKGYLKKEKNYRKNKKEIQDTDCKIIEYDYVSDGKYSLSFVATLSAIVLSFMLIAGIIYPQNKFNMVTRFNEWKEGTRDFAERLALVGFWGMLNPDRGAGGVGRSRLGQAEVVRLDYQPDLIVTLLYDNMEQSIYLKSFNGTFYRDEFWETLSENKDNDVKLKDYGLDEENIKNLTFELNDIYDLWFLGSNKNITVTNVGANSAFYYHPYYSFVSGDIRMTIDYDDEILGGIKRNNSMTINYTPILFHSEKISDLKQQVKNVTDNFLTNNDESEYPVIEIEKKYKEYVYDIYLDVPKENLNVIKDFCEKHGIHKESDNIVEEVINVFDKEYEYSLMPGRTPKNKEFINYFLSESKKGYCTYFASSAVLIYRYLGIPARYCGGYVLSANEMESAGEELSIFNSEELMLNLDKWTTEGVIYANRNTRGICEYEVDDSMAHAWVEIYIDGLGWYPVEVTPPDYNNEYLFREEDNNNIMGFLTDNVITGENILAIRQASKTIVVGTGVIVIIFIGSYILLGIVVRCIRKGYRPVNKKYLYLCKCAQYIGIKKSGSRTYEEFARLICEKEIMDEEIIFEVIRIVEKNKFSPYGIGKDEIKYVSDKINEASKTIYLKIKWYKKFVYRFINWL